MPVDPTKLQQLLGGSKVTTRTKKPFDDLSPDEHSDKSFRFRTNPYERALFNYVAGLRGKGESMQSLMRTLAREGALAELAKRGG